MDDRPPAEAPRSAPQLAAANNRFGFKLLGELTRKSVEKNVFVSPSSVGMCLAMACNGALGETRRAMLRALEAQDFTLDQLDRAYADLEAALEGPDAGVKLEIANSLWAGQGLRFVEDFIRRATTYFRAQVTALDFADPGAEATLNRWVGEKTHGKIERIVDRIDPQSILFLVNAIYFKGAWQRPFDKARTVEERFTLARGARRVPMMSQSGSYEYLETKDFQALRLPYGGERVSLYVFLPSSRSSLPAFEKTLTESNWRSWMEAFHEMDGDIRLPRLRVAYEATLNDALKALGMSIAFEGGRADFSGMIASAGRNVYVSSVKHKTFVEVNEEGTEAAAATSTEMRITSAQKPSRRFLMVVDHPFFCAIRDQASGAVLFMGSIHDPQ